MKNAKKAARKTSFDYTVLAQAIANAALSRRAALQMEMCVSLLHFTQETDGADTTGKANLKAIYNAAGYDCLAKVDRDYKTVNRRINAMAKLFDKLGSSLVNGWIADKGDTEATLNYIATELDTYAFYTLDDVHEYVGVETSTKRQAKQTSGPVTVTTPEPSESEEEEQAEEAAAPAAFDAVAILASVKANMTPDQIREFVTSLLVHVAETEKAAEKEEESAAAPASAGAQDQAGSVVTVLVPQTGTKRKNTKKQQREAAAAARMEQESADFRKAMGKAA